jgi:hypothetical protein
MSVQEQERVFDVNETAPAPSVSAEIPTKARISVESGVGALRLSAVGSLPVVRHSAVIADGEVRTAKASERSVDQIEGIWIGVCGVLTVLEPFFDFVYGILEVSNLAQVYRRRMPAVRENL